MSVMSLLDLQCSEAMSAIETALASLGYLECDSIPALVVIEAATSAAQMLTPINAWEVTIPYLLRWAYEQFAVAMPLLN